MTSIPIVELQYYQLCGRGEPIRLLLEDAGVAYVETHDVKHFNAKKWDPCLG